MTPGQQHSAPAPTAFAADVARAATGNLPAEVDPGGLPVVVTGHSLGGALATLLAADLTAMTPLKPQAWTFASPHVGDAAFAARYGALSTVSWRIGSQDRVMLDFAVKLTHAPEACDEHEVARLREAGFTDADILHIVEVTAIFNYNVRLATATGLFPNPEYHELGRALAREG